MFTAGSLQAHPALMRNRIAVDHRLHSFDRTLLAVTYSARSIVDPETGRARQQASRDASRQGVVAEGGWDCFDRRPMECISIVASRICSVIWTNSASATAIAQSLASKMRSALGSRLPVRRASALPIGGLTQAKTPRQLAREFLRWRARMLSRVANLTRQVDGA